MKAKRGDAVAIVSETRDYVIGQASSAATRVELGIVTSTTRDGVVKAFRSAGWGDSSRPIERVVGFRQAVIIPATQIAPDDVVSVAKAHHWPGHPNQPRPFESLEEVKAALKPYLIGSAAPAAA